MKASADLQTSSAPPSPDASPATSTVAPTRKPRFAIFIATAGGLGYLPKAPGTWGSFVALPIYFLVYAYYYFFYFPTDYVADAHAYAIRNACAALTALTVSILLAGMGVWAADRTAGFSGKKDPQSVVIDEVSGQHLALFLGSVLPIRWTYSQTGWPGFPSGAAPHSVISWKYLLLGFILFRLFDIWKPFPARQAEFLPGGWGIMADDWIAAIYAAIGLWIARAAGL